MVFQPTGCTGDTPRTGWSTAASGRSSLVHVHHHSVSGSSQGLHQTIRRQRHAALVTLWQLVMVLASSTKIGTGFCTGTSRPVDDSAYGDQKCSIIIFGRAFLFYFFLSVMIPMIPTSNGICESLIKAREHHKCIFLPTVQFKQGSGCGAYRVIEPVHKFTTHKPTDKKVLLYLPCSHQLHPVLEVSPPET